MKILILLIFLLTLSPVFGQNKEIISKNKDLKINTGFLLGFWKQDSSAVKIEFRLVHNQLQLIHHDISFYDFHFFGTDSFPLTGVSMTWPPHNCSVKKLGAHRIEIEYAMFMQKPSFARFSRINPAGLPPAAW